MKTASKIIIPGIVLILAVAATMVLLGLKEDSAKRPPTLRSKVVETAVVKLQPVRTLVSAYGRVASAQPVQVYAEATGML